MGGVGAALALRSAGIAAATSGEAGHVEAEEVIDSRRPIVDPHHHLWDHPGDRYLLLELLKDLNDGHHVTKTVFVEAGSMYRADAPPELRSLGETEFADGVAAMSASGIYGDSRVAAGIIGSVDLRLKGRARDILEAHIAVGGGRFRGIRTTFPADEHFPMHGVYPADVLTDPAYREGFAQLAQLGLICDVWCLFSQLPTIASLADAFPHTTLVINHLGTPVLTGYYSSRQDEVFGKWKAGLSVCARRPNIVLKLGGLGMKFGSYLFFDAPPSGSEALAKAWRQYIEAGIALFGVERCMFESNYPADRATCSYRTLWNVFKRITSSYSEDEKTALFSANAARIYRI
jgi:predicted TIM-barrel fold metal-dependent hydrolase